VPAFAQAATFDEVRSAAIADITSGCEGEPLCDGGASIYLWRQADGSWDWATNVQATDVDAWEVTIPAAPSYSRTLLDPVGSLTIVQYITTAFFDGVGWTAEGPVIPDVPFGSYFDSVAVFLVAQLGLIFPLAAALTAFLIGVVMVKRWLGRRKATQA
jgi:hypothetical protein